MYRIGSCACSSMGRGKPEGPPHVRASRKRVRMEEERVEPRRLRISLRPSPLVGVEKTERGLTPEGLDGP